MEVFYEESSNYRNQSEKTKYKLIRIISIIFYVFAGVWLIFAFNTLDFNVGIILYLLFLLLPPALFIFAGVFIGKRKNNYCIDYDYTFVSGSIRCSKVINSIKRIHLFNFDASAIEIIGKVSNTSFKKYQSMPDVKVEYLTSNDTPEEGKNFYYIFAKVNSEKKVIVLECSELFIANVLKFSKRMVLEKDN